MLWRLQLVLRGTDMDEELYAHDKYKGYHIYTILDADCYYSSIYHNGTCFKDNVKAISYERVLGLCKDIVDAWEDMDE